MSFHSIEINPMLAPSSSRRGQPIIALHPEILNAEGLWKEFLKVFCEDRSFSFVYHDLAGFVTNIAQFFAIRPFGVSARQNVNPFTFRNAQRSDLGECRTKFPHCGLTDGLKKISARLDQVAEKRPGVIDSVQSRHSHSHGIVLRIKKKTVIGFLHQIRAQSNSCKGSGRAKGAKSGAGARTD